MPVPLNCGVVVPVCREEHPDLVESMAKKGSNVPEKPKTPQQLWYNHEKKAFLKTHPDVGHNASVTSTHHLSGSTGAALIVLCFTAGDHQRHQGQSGQAVDAAV